MTEHKIENIILEKLEMMLKNIDAKIQIIGVWQTVRGGLNKLEEDAGYDGVAIVKVQPRAYQTPTIPDGSMDVTINLSIRQDIDNTGEKFLQASDKLNKLLAVWQKSYSIYSSDFRLDGEFEPTGFQTMGGDVSIDQANSIMSLTVSCQLYGIFSDVY